MRLKQARWIPLLLGALAGASGFVWLPAPVGLAQEELRRRDPGFGLEGKAEFRWATGTLRVREARLTFAGAELAVADAILVRLDLRPWQSRRATAARVVVEGWRADLDAARLEILQRLKQENPGAMTFEVELAEGALGWTLEDGRRVAAEGISGRLLASIGSDRRTVTHGVAVARLVEPFAATLDLRLRLGPDPAAWELSAEVEALALPAPLALGLEQAGLDWKHAQFRGRVHLQPELWRLDLHGSAEGLRHKNVPLPITLDALHVTGDARRALRAEVRAHTPHGSLNAELQLARSPASLTADPWTGWSYDGRAQIQGLNLDEGLRTRLTPVVPLATQILDNLGLSGATSAHLRLSGELAPDAPPPRFLAAVPFAGLGFRYMGFADRRTGERFAYPEPIALQIGHVVAADNLILLHGEGQLLEAEPDPQEAPGLPPRILAGGSILIEGEVALVDLDIQALRHPVGPLLGRRLAANPALAKLWDELGSPRGGRAEAMVRLRSLGSHIQVFVDAHASHVRAAPPLLGETVSAETVDFHYSDGDLSIGGVVSAAGIRAQAQVRSQRTADGGTEWTGVAAGSGLPRLDPAAPWVGALGMPPEILEASWAGEADWQVALRLPLTLQRAAPVQTSLAIGLQLREASVALPSQGLVLSEAHGATGLALGAGGYSLMAENGRAWWSEAPLQVGARLHGRDFRGLAGSLSLTLTDARLANEQSQRLLRILGLEAWGVRKRLEGRFSANLDLPVNDPLAARGRVDLAPLQLELQPLRRAARQEAARFELSGRLVYSAGQIDARDLTLAGPEVELLLRDCQGTLDASGLTLEGRVLSALGMQLRPPLGLVASQSVLNALDQIGLDGRIAPRDLRFTIALQAGAAPQVTAAGSMELSRFRLAGPPPVEEGAGVLTCEQFSYRGPEDFSGRFRLDEGSAIVAGVRVTGARAELQIGNERAVVTRFAADALGGRVATDWIDEQGAGQHGSFALGLAERADVRAEFRFDDFLLERMGEELGFRGPLAGKLSGLISLRSPDPSPINYRGSVRLDIRDGVLGTVPVLAQIWRLVGIESPTFNEGRLRLTMLGEGRILVDELSLKHPLLEVTGERLMTMDSYLGLKVTVRTFGFFGRLPLVRDVLDWFVEQDVYGPAAAPRLRQRGLGKILVGDPERIPFPLWVPPVQRPDWRRSPALPADA